MSYHFNAFIVSVIMLFGGLFEVERAKRIERQLKQIAAALGRLPGRLDADFIKFALRLSDQSQQIDALNATLGVLAALEFAALTYVVDKSMAVSVSALMRVFAGSILLPVAMAVGGMLGFRPRQSPDLGDLEVGLRSDQRTVVLAKAVHQMAEDFTYNRDQIARKQGLLELSIGLVMALVVVAIIGKVIY